MSTDAHRMCLAVTVDYLMAKRRSLLVPPRLVMVHGHHQPRTLCLPGENIETAYLQYSTPKVTVPLRLSLAGLMLCDCLVRFHHTPLSIARIGQILTSDAFYRRLGANPPRFTRASLKIYIARLRMQLDKAMKESGSLLSGKDALVSESTDSNVLVHRLTLPVEIVHQDGRPM